MPFFYLSQDARQFAPNNTSQCQEGWCEVFLWAYLCEYRHLYYTLGPILHWESWFIPGICNRGFITAPPDDTWIFFSSSVKLVRTSPGESIDPSADPFHSCCPSLTRRSMIGWANVSLMLLPDTASLRVVATFGSSAIMSCWNTCSAVSLLFHRTPSWIKLYVGPNNVACSVHLLLESVKTKCQTACVYVFHQLCTFDKSSWNWGLLNCWVLLAWDYHLRREVQMAATILLPSFYSPSLQWACQMLF